MNRINTYIIYISIVSLILASSSCKNDLEKLNEVFSSEHSTQEIIENVSISYSDSADVKFELDAPLNVRITEGTHFTDKFPKGVEVRFINDGVVFATLTANDAERYSRKKKTYLRNDVLFVNQKGERLKTSEMIWDEKTGAIYSTKFAILESADKRIQGYGFYTDEDFEKIEVGPLEGKVKMDQQE